jgi:hypothetical protein
MIIFDMFLNHKLEEGLNYLSAFKIWILDLMEIAAFKGFSIVGSGKSKISRMRNIIFSLKYTLKFEALLYIFDDKNPVK